MKLIPEWAPRLFLAVVVVACIFVLYACLAHYETEAEDLPPSPYDAHLLELDKHAVDMAFEQQLTHLFLTWMKDPTGQPERAVAGARKARAAYIAVMNEVSRREQQQRH